MTVWKPKEGPGLHQKPQSKISGRLRSRIPPVPMSGTCALPPVESSSLYSVTADRYLMRQRRGETQPTFSIPSPYASCHLHVAETILVYGGKVRASNFTICNAMIRTQGLQIGGKAWSWGSSLSQRRRLLRVSLSPCPLESHLCPSLTL